MTPIQQQFQILKDQYEGASLQPLPSGAFLITIPDYKIPEGWSHDKVKIKFIVPIGYPLAKPDCFWVDPQQLRLSGGAMPQNSNIQSIPEVNENHLWFSWHIAKWNPNRDSLSSYIKVIEARLRELR